MITTIVGIIAQLLPLAPGFANTAKAFWDDVTNHNQISADEKTKLYALKPAAVDAENIAVQNTPLDPPAPTSQT